MICPELTYYDIDLERLVKVECLKDECGHWDIVKQRCGS